LINVNGAVNEYAWAMPSKAAPRRQRGYIRKRGNSYQVLVYAGTDPLTGKAHYLTESSPTEAKASQALTRLLAQVDGQRNARTKATLGVALDAWLRVHEVEANTHRAYAGYIRLHIKPALGHVPLSKITAQTLEEFYAELRRCRARCDGRPRIDHRTQAEHECRTVRHRTRRRPHDCTEAGCTVVECRPHVCRPFSAQMIRQIHFTISGALAAAVRWDWISTNPAVVAKKPRQPQPRPEPPSAEQAARIIEAAWAQDEAWGTLVWLTMVTGMRRAELLALRWHDVDLVAGMLAIRRNYVWLHGQAIEKDTKTHQMRRIALDTATVDILAAHRQRYEDRARAIDLEPSQDAYLFSHQPEAAKPFHPSAVSHRYVDMCATLGITSHLHALRHYSATELLTAGVDLRTVAGRLGHAGGGATTLRVYAAWVGESDRRAAEILSTRLQRPCR
jgi:integrase